MAVRILHCHSTFSLGGKEARAVRLMNAFGDAAEHVVVSAMPDKLGARDAIDRGVRVVLPGRRAGADRAADAAAPVEAVALSARLRSGADLQLGRVQRGDGAAAVRRPAAYPP